MAALQETGVKSWLHEDNKQLKSFDKLATKALKEALSDNVIGNLREGLDNLTCDIISAIVEDMPLTPAEYAGLKAGTHRVVALAS